ncbi:putative fatty acyl-CoA reductase CG8306 [Formica exsecta]|uniref:putative fatty acyl-CoA reductase CG8306 n=1 Tax=Formica exsecta TaxID=72781 RepID=UPI00114444E1|nr:putative fatty acyl-CoA reductase CG8306 [Formica exsecta]
MPFKKIMSFYAYCILQLFDRLRSEQPHCFEKLIPLKGDIEVEELGLSSADRNMLIEKVSIIFHVAANVRFDNTLKKTVLLNIRSTRDICVLGKSLKNLVVLVHVSSTYTQVDKPVVDEIVYPMEIDWRKTIQIAETVNDYVLEVFKSKYLGTMPNSYVFTKRLAEQVITDYSKSLPCVICRPSIISPTLNEPIKGWLDSFGGPVGLIVGCGKGIIRVFYNNPSICDNFIPADITVKAMIVAGWKRGVINKNNDTQNIHPFVYNCTSNHSMIQSRLNTIQIGNKTVAEYPLEDIIWTPGLIMTQSYFCYYILVLLLHIIPAVFIDGLLQIAGKNPRLLKQQRKIFVNINNMTHFLFNEWNFRNQKLLSLSNEVPPDNQRDFGFAVDLNYNYNNLFLYYRNCTIGSKMFLLNESMDRLDAARFHYKRMLWIDRIVKILIGILFIRIMYGIYIDV